MELVEVDLALEGIMFQDIEAILDSLTNTFSRLHILVVGDLMLDRFLWGEVSRISPEAPVPVVKFLRQTETAGGAGNVALNLVSLGAHVTAAGFVGADEEGHALLGLMKRAGVDVQDVVVLHGLRTTTKTRIIGGHQQVVRLDIEDAGAPPPEAGKRLRANLQSRLAQEPSAAILSDYAKGVLGEDVCQAVIRQTANRHVPVLVDPKGVNYSKYARATAISPNRAELALATGAAIHDLDAVYAEGKRLRHALALEFLTVTLGDQGIALIEPDSLEHFPALASQVFDVSGAGDTVMATLALGLAAGLHRQDAIRLANLAAGIVVGKVGTVPIHRNELRDALLAQRPPRQASKVLPLGELRQQMDLWRARGERVVFTNGCFDLLHVGHVTYLEQARRQGDRLVIGLNTDRSVRALKGKNRPLIPERDRARVLASLAAVDAVVFFDDDTPLEVIQALRPEVLVKGNDYREDQVVGAKEVRSWGGQVVLMPLEQGWSTTQMVEKAARVVMNSTKNP